MRICALVASFIIVIAIPLTSVECAKKMDLDGLRDMLKPMAKSCMKKTGVTQETIAGTHRGEFPRERPLMCFYKCLSTLLKIMDKQGQVVLKSVESQIDMLVKEEFAGRMKEIGRICYDSTERKDDACEYAFDIVVCGYKIDSLYYIVP